MFPQRALPRLSQQLRSPILRRVVQRRGYAVEGGTIDKTGQGLKLAGKEIKLEGPADNAFNRERAAVKAHAAATSDLWRRLSIYVVIPCIILGGINAYNLWVEHWNHWEHLPPLEERVEYPYQNIRTKPFPWGDGDKTLFWNDKVNYHKKDKVT